MFESRSPLAERLALGGRDGADGARALRFTEIRGRHVVQLGLFGGDPVETMRTAVGRLAIRVGERRAGDRPDKRR